MKLKMKSCIALFLSVILCQYSLASGVLPASSVVIVNESSGDGSIIVTNTEKYPVLLTTELLNVDPKYQDLVVATPQLIRVEPNAKQLVRFLLTGESSLEHEVLMRVIFEGIPPETNSDSEQINFTIRQNMPLIIKPKSLVENSLPWELLSWKYENNELRVSNTSPYIVRLSSGVNTEPGNIQWELPSNYVLPNQSLILKTNSKVPSFVEKITIQPFTQWGYSTTKKYTTKLKND